jgi:hypothetical protein
MARQVVTDAQLLAAWQEFGTFKAVARVLRVDRGTVRTRIQRMALQPPVELPPPEGFHVVQVCQDGEGNVKSVKSRPDPEEPHREGVPAGHTVTGLSTLYGEGGQVVGQWVKTKAEPVGTVDMLAAIDTHMEQYRGGDWCGSSPICIGHPNQDLLNAFVWGDPHIGLLAHARETGANFDLKIAVADLEKSAVALVRKMPIAGTALFLETGDLWHAQDDKQVTPRGGNKLDVDGRKSKILEQGLCCTRNMIDLLLERHEKVVIAIVPGNHDPDNAIVTRIWLQAVYENSSRVEILDNANPYMYYRWNNNFFMMTHGDKRVKPQELGEIMLADRPMDVGQCQHRRAFTGHVHHKNVQEFRTFRWESFNSLCARDFWHHSEGYRSERLVEAITFHARFGEDSRARVTHQEILDR